MRGHNGRVAANTPADANSLTEVEARAEAERIGRPFLVLTDGERRERVLTFAAGVDSVSVGRRSSSDLALTWDDQVSRLHARFERAGDRWELVDDGFSSNGTFINDERLRGRRGLRDADVLRFGTTRVTFHLPRPQPAAPPRPTPAVELSTTQRRVLASLCRPYKGANGFASPATDEQIAEDLVLSVGEVRTHLRVLCAKLGIETAAGRETRVRLAERAFSAGLISQRDL
jgi:hypothetical protein